METVREEAPKRPSDEDDNDDDKKKLKTGQEVGPMMENIQNVNDVNKRNLLPSIVYELLALFKKSEKLNSDEDGQDKIDNDIKEDFKVLPDQNCQEKLLDNAFRHENLKEVDRCNNINNIENANLQASTTASDYIQNVNELDFAEKYTTEGVPNKVPSITKVSPIKLFAENTGIHEVKRTEDDEKNGKTSAVKNVCHLPVSAKSVPCIDESTNYISKAVMSTESVSSAATSTNSIYNTPMPTSKTSIPNTPKVIFINSTSNMHMLSTTNNNTIIVSESSAHKTENILRVQMLEFLNKNCFDSISGIPLTKPPRCICKYCTIATSLPIKQSAVYNLLFNDDLNSNVPVTDCSITATNDCCVNKSNTPYRNKKTLINIESPKNIWVNDLTSLISKNEYTSKKYLATKTNASIKCNPVQNVINKVHKVTQNIKLHLSFCNKCKKYKFSESGSCKCYSSSYKSY